MRRETCARDSPPSRVIHRGRGRSPQGGTLGRSNAWLASGQAERALEKLHSRLAGSSGSAVLPLSHTWKWRVDAREA